MDEPGGRTLPFVFGAEDEAVPTTRERTATGGTVHADEARGWDALHARFDTRRINHSVAFSDDGAGTNQAESYVSRLRRAEWGPAPPHLRPLPRRLGPRDGVAGGPRRNADGALHTPAAGAALTHPVSRSWNG